MMSWDHDPRAFGLEGILGALPRMTQFCVRSSRLHVFAIVLIMLGAPFALLIVVARHVDTTPTLTIEPLVVDLGPCRAGDTVTGWFRIRNDYTVPFRIADIKSGCSCTVPEWDNAADGLLRPNSSTQLALTLNVPTNLNRVTEDIVVIYMRADDTSTRSRYTKAQVLAHVVHDYRLDATHLDFGVLDGASPVTKHLHLRGEAQPAIEILGLRCTHESYLASARQIARDPNEWIVKVTLPATEEIPHGVGEAQLIITTNSPLERNARVRISGRLASIPKATGDSR